MKKHLILLLLAGLSLVRCATDMGPVDTTVSVRLAIITATTPPDTVYKGDWDSFYFYADTVFYHSPTWEDVRNKKLRTREELAGNTATAKNTPDGTGEPADTTHVRFNHLTGKAILVILDPDSAAYAWRSVDLVDGLPEVALSFYFRKKETAPNTLNKWFIVPNPNPAKPEPTE